MSDDEDNFQLYGTLLEPFEEDAVPKKRAFTIEDQIATDEQGRRRFHGAFTGGFSAGFFNTVGSLEGWQPSEFKSSRSEKASKKCQKPQDFMDDEDLGEFGIAPTVVRATTDYAVKANRKRVREEGAIPGVPVLHTLLQPVKDTVGVKLLKQMGWKPGQGVGPRLSKSEKRRVNRENKTGRKVYGCEVPAEFLRQIVHSDHDDEESSSDDDELTFAPDDYDPFIVKPKDNSFGMGYTGLDKRPILSSHINLFDPPELKEFKMRDHKNSKLSIAGQAFGVGAFEQEDEDIYTRDDMSKYDFELDSFSKKNKNIKKIRDVPNTNEQLGEKILEGFVISKNPAFIKKQFKPPVLPKNFIPKHGVRMSRFEPLPETHKLYNYDRSKTQGRHDLSAAERSKIINSETILVEKTPKTFEAKILSGAFNVPVEKETETLIKNVAKKTHTPLNTNFKPFMIDPDKQKRYEQYLTLETVGRDRQLHEIQPGSMADWEKERERYEFAQASRMFKPVAGLVFDKFVVGSESLGSEVTPVASARDKTIYQHGTQDMRDAAKKKMFGPLTRTIEIWIPNKLLCKRFNVPEPDVTEIEMSLSKKKKGKFNVFDYYEAYQQNKKEGPEPLQPLQNEKSTESTKEVVEEQIESKEDEVKEIETKEVEVETKIETFKTSREIFLEESSPSTSKSFYKKSDPKEPEPIVIPTDPKEKKDLFKAIFLSSSESEDEKSDNETQKMEQKEEMKKIVLEEQHTTQFDQPIINASKGIFSNLDWSKVNRGPISRTPKEQEPSPQPPKQATTIIEEIDEDIYGPKLPTNLEKPKPIPEKTNITTIDSSSSSEDEWTEASKGSKDKEKSNKISKKHKKHKSKHKKHKSKHKKKKSKH